MLKLDKMCAEGVLEIENLYVNRWAGCCGWDLENQQAGCELYTLLRLTTHAQQRRTERHVPS
jgi:hypothetical protein